MLNNKAPSRRAGELDNRGSHYFVAQYWAKALADQDEDAELKAEFAPIAEKLLAEESVIVDELNKVQGPSVDVGGYFKPSDDLASVAMRPSATLNALIDG